MSYASPLIRATDSIARACCYIAVFSLPLYFSLLTTTGFEPDKAVLLRVLAAIAGCAWLIGAIARGHGFFRSVNAVLWAAVALFLALVVATILSIDPRLSFWGSQVRQEGLVTWMGYLVFLVVAATRLRGTEEWNRLVTALLLGSVPVAAYGYLQELGIDPVSVGGDPNTLQWPVRSTLGQHVFLGSYLVMVLPFALARAIQSWWPNVLQSQSDVAPGAVPEARGLSPAPQILGATPWPPIALLAGLLAVVFLFITLGANHPAMFAVYPGILTVSAGVVVLVDRYPVSEAIARWGYTALSILLFLVLAFSGARGAWLGALAGLPVFGLLLAWRLRRTTLARTVLATGILGGAFLILLNVPNGPLQPLRTIHALSRISNITDSGGAEGSAQGRVLIWRGVGDLMSGTPSVGSTWGGPARDLVGYGPETLHWAFQAVFPLELRRVTSEIWTWDRSHDIFLDVLVDAGVLGLLAFLATIAMFGWVVVRTVRTVAPPRAWILTAMSAAVAGHLVDGLFGLETPVTLLPLFLMFGLAAQAPFSENGEVPQNPVDVGQRAPSLLPFAAIAVALCVSSLVLVAVSPAPQLLGVLWMGSIVLGVAAISWLLVPLPLEFRPSRQLSARAVLLAGAGVVCLLVLWTQLRYQTAAFAELSGVSALANNNFVAAVAGLQLAARENPYEPQYRTELSGAYLSLGASHIDSATPSYVPVPADIVTVSPTLASGFSRDQLFTLGLYALQSARDMSPLDPDAYGNLGSLELEWGRAAEALNLFRQAERLSHQNPRYLDQEAMAELQLGRTRRAQSSGTQALALDNTFWYSYYTNSLVDQRLANRPAARQAAQQALAWMHNYWPPPPQSQVDQLKQLARFG